MISLNWVGDYIDIQDQDVKELATLGVPLLPAAKRNS